MSIKRTFLNLFLFLIVAGAFSCGDKKEKEQEETKSTLDKALLTQKLWKCEAMLVNGSDFSAYVNPATISFLFKTDGTYHNTFMDKVENGTWEFVPGKEQLLINKGTSNQLVITVLLLSEEKLNMELDGLDTDFKSKVQYRLVH
jgi:hypothetical protein